MSNKKTKISKTNSQNANKTIIYKSNNLTTKKNYTNQKTIN